MAAIFPSCELGEIAELYDSLHQTPQYAAEGYPMIRVTDIRPGFVNTAGAVRVDEETYQQFSKKHTPQIGDILFSRVGSYGNSAYVSRNEEFCLGQNTVCISPKKSRIEPVFLYCALNSDDLRSQIESMVGGASQGTISLKSIRKLQVPIPPLPVQRRIAGILSAYDDLIENNQRRIKILEEMARSLYREWFVHFRFPGHEKVKMVPSPIGPIPQCWEVKPLFDICQVRYGKNLPTKNLSADGPYPVYGAAKVIGHYTEYTRDRRTLICGCRGSVGEMQITQPQCFVTNNSFTFDPAHPDSFFWLFYALKERGLRDVIGGAAQPQITLDGISSIELAMPPLPLLRHFQQSVEAMFEQAWILDSQIRNLRRTRNLLLPRLLSGQVGIEIGAN